MRRFLLGTLAIAGALAASVAVALPLWLTGHVSRVNVRSASPDGRLEGDHGPLSRRGWSPDGTFLVVVNDGNTLVMIDPATGARLGVHGSFAPGDGWGYTSGRVITTFRFTGRDSVEFEHCDRILLRQPGPDGLYSRCGTDVRRGRARIVRSGDRALVSHVMEL